MCGLVLVVFQVTQADVVAPNPGHALSCHRVSGGPCYGNGATYTVCTATCDYGTAVGGGCYCPWASSYCYFGGTPSVNTFTCTYGVMSATYYVSAYVTCCEAI